MRVGVISDSPALTTGYGIVTDRCCRALLAAGHTLVCFGFKDDDANPARRRYPCPVEPIDPFEAWHGKLRRFVREGAFDVLWVYIDAYNLEEVMGVLASTELPPSALYAIFDGLPAYRRLTALVAGFDAVMTTTQVAADYLARCGIAVDAVAPPGVDAAVFRPLPGREELRRRCGLNGKRVVGVFGRNTERKQQPRVLEALARLRARGRDDIVAYFHCRARGYWDLDDLARRLGVLDCVAFADPRFDETRGVPLRGAAGAGPAARVDVPRDLGYVERLNLCDLVVNVPHSGDFEQVLIEAPACGVPVAGTDDGGIMRAALGPGRPLYAPAANRGNAGQDLHYVCADALAAAIDAGLGSGPAERAAAAAWARAHDWSRLERAVVSVVRRAVERGGAPRDGTVSAGADRADG